MVLINMDRINNFIGKAKDYFHYSLHKAHEALIKGIDLNSDLKLLYDVAKSKKRYLTMFGILIARLLYRLEDIYFETVKRF